MKSDEIGACFLTVAGAIMRDSLLIILFLGNLPYITGTIVAKIRGLQCGWDRS